MTSTDLAVFKRFFQLMGFNTRSITRTDGTSAFYATDNGGTEGPPVSSKGYEEIDLVAEFDIEDKLIRAHMHSHVAYFPDEFRELQSEVMS